ncbi:lipopolysaccharide biosynthesis protein [Herbaspirillum huttiense]|uniref:lipopolysaccharide biosynthesis protein n=1 Tax=Herbaspirillum huttiense TaxID=863372 RepID=UPI0039AFD0BA
MPNKAIGTSKGGLLSNSRWNLLAFGIALIAQFLSIPFVVRWIGLEEFGIAAVLIAVCAPMTLIGTVLGQALTREVASSATIDDLSLSRMVAATLRLGLISCGGGAILLLCVAPFIAHRLIGSSVQVTTFDYVAPLLIVTAGCIAQQVSLILQGISAAKQDYRSIAFITLFSAVAGTGVTLILTRLLPSSTGYLLGLSSSFGITMVIWFFRWRSSIDWHQVLTSGHAATSAPLMRFGKWQGLAQLAGMLGNQIDRYALGVLAPVTIVGQYSIANRLQEAAYIGVVKVGEVLFPRFGAMSDHSLPERQQFFQLCSWSLGVISTSMLVPLALLAHDVLSLWVGKEVAAGGDRILVVLVLGGVVGAASNVFTYYAMGMARNVAVAAISVLFSVLTVSLTVIFIATIGAAAAGVGLLLASIARVAASMILTRRIFFPSLLWKDLFVSTALPVGIGIAVTILCRNFVDFNVNSWFSLIPIYAALATLIMAICVALSCLTSCGREFIQLIASSIKRHRYP